MNEHSKYEPLPFVFFGTPGFAVTVLDELEKKGFVPSLVVTAPDKPAGRGLALTPTPVKTWALERGIRVISPNKLKTEEFLNELRSVDAPVFVLAAYGKIIPDEVLSIPPKGILNVHPSLLPRYRGASPIESQILENEENVGVSVIVLDNEMDHGPIVADREVETPHPLPDAPALEELLSHAGGELLADSLASYVEGAIVPREQEHAKATYTKKFSKEDAELDLGGDPLENYLKIQAFKRRPRAYFFIEKEGLRLRVIPTSVRYDSEEGLVIERVIPEGSKEIAYSEFEKSL